MICEIIRSSCLVAELSNQPLQEFTRILRGFGTEPKSQKWCFSGEIRSDSLLILCSEQLFQKFYKNRWSPFFKKPSVRSVLKFTRITRILVKNRLTGRVGRGPAQKFLVKSKVVIPYKVPMQYETDRSPHDDTRAHFRAPADFLGLGASPEWIPI